MKAKLPPPSVVAVTFCAADDAVTVALAIGAWVIASTTRPRKVPVVPARAGSRAWQKSNAAANNAAGRRSLINNVTSRELFGVKCTPGARQLPRACTTNSRRVSVEDPQSPLAAFDVEQPRRELQPEADVGVVQVDLQCFGGPIQAVAKRIGMHAQRLSRFAEAKALAGERRERQCQISAVLAPPERCV